MGEDDSPQAPMSSAIGARIEAPKKWGVKRGCPPPHSRSGLEKGHAPSQKIIDVGSQYDEFWCIL